MADPTELAGQALSLQDEVAEAEERLSELKKALRTLVEVDLPEAMRDSGMHKMTVMAGNREVDVSLKQSVTGSLSRVKDQQGALEYLEGTGFKGAAGATVELKLDTGEEAVRLCSGLIEEGYDPRVKRQIHPQTLAAHARAVLARGEPFELDKVGLVALQKAVIKEKT